MLWISHSFWPTQMEELQQALAIESDDENFYEDDIFDATAIIANRSSLVI